jgi:hypothetical protein
LLLYELGLVCLEILSELLLEWALVISLTHSLHGLELLELVLLGSVSLGNGLVILLKAVLLLLLLFSLRLLIMIIILFIRLSIILYEADWRLLSLVDETKWRLLLLELQTRLEVVLLLLLKLELLVIIGLALILLLLLELLLDLLHAMLFQGHTIDGHWRRLLHLARWHLELLRWVGRGELCRYRRLCLRLLWWLRLGLRYSWLREWREVTRLCL